MTPDPNIGGHLFVDGIVRPVFTDGAGAIAPRRVARRVRSHKGARLLPARLCLKRGAGIRIRQ
jgi:hypothetical protein